MAQINPTVGAIEENADKIIQIIATHQNSHDVIVFPELALVGYPPEDLLFRPELWIRVEKALKKITAVVNTPCHVIIGYPLFENGKLYNAASVIHNCKCEMTYHKQHLPNYSVFDEQRYFTPGKATPCIFTLKNVRLGLCICEDLWQPGPVEQIAAAEADVMLCINASPFDYDKQAIREALLKQCAIQHGLMIIYVNQIGGQDELVFDGQSIALGSKGNVCARSPAFAEHLQTLILRGSKITGTMTPQLEKNALIYQALVCGLRDYVHKNNFPGVLLGLSGGIDSALVLAIAVDALGASRVHAVMMPSRFTAMMSKEDALLQLKSLDVSHTTLSIEPTFESLIETLSPAFKGLPADDKTEENLQARIRGTLLMALSNKKGYLVLCTSNKSETAVGYTTLYGDMCGGFAVIKDVLKTKVYTLARYRNTLSMVIPERVLTRPPSAELAPDQTDQDSLPDYAILDKIITFYMVDHLSIEEITQHGYPHDIVRQVVNLIKHNEYKRRQAAPGVKITACSFDKDWRYPITSKF